MASTYVNDLRLNEMATGDASGSWGTITNTNLELIGEALGYGTEGITTNANNHTSTIADGATDPVRALYVEYTGTLDSACTITIAPNTVNKFCFIENGTSGSQNIIIKQGSGATITIPPGDSKAVYLDGAGSGAKVVDAFASLSVVDLKVQDDLTVTDDMTVGGTLGVTGVLTATSLDISGDIDVDGITNLDVVDIDGAVDMASTLAVAGVVTANAGVVVDNITIDGTTIALSSGDLTLDVAGDIILDADGADIVFKDAGTAFGKVSKSSNDFRLKSEISDGDFVVQGVDNGSVITALTLDMSAAGAATFNAGVTATGLTVGNSAIGSNTSHLANLTINNNGNIGSANNTSAIQIVTGGDVNFNQKVVANSTSSGDYVRMYAGSGTGKWDIYGSGANLRFSDNDSAGSVQFDTKVGIGESSPLGILHLKKTDTGNSPQNSAGNQLVIENGDSSGSADIQFLSANNGYNHIFFGDAADANVGTLLYDHTNNSMQFITNASERLRINANARICINGNATTNGHGNFVGEVGANSKALMFEHTVGGGETGSITTGSSSAAYNTSSDYRLKENVVPMTGSIDRVKALKPSRFNFILDADKTVDGFLAHEAQAVVPESVTGTKDAMRDEEYEVTAAIKEVRDADDNITTEATEAVMGTRSVPDMQGIDQAKLVPLLVAALQEALAKIDAIETRLTALEG
mgnify:CR=1 FL=1